MENFVDTSALYALVIKKDINNRIAVETWEKLTEHGGRLVTNNYVLVECISLLQSRIGLESAIYIQNEVVPFLTVVWVDEDQHAAAVHHLLSASRRNLSLVDCSAFETMRRLGIDTVFTFDEHFREQGFKVIP